MTPRAPAGPRPARNLAPLGRFASVGAVTTLLDLGAFQALCGLGAPAAAANLASYSLGIALSFTLNARWTFGGRGGAARAVRFAASNVMGLGLSTALVAALGSVMPALAAKVLSVPAVFAWNYAMASRWVFAARRDGA